jgi:hypothetical protein
MIGWIALAATAQAATAPAPNKADPPQAIVSGHTVAHKAAGLTIKVPASATYVGAERFDLYGVADAEIQVFAEADKDKRLTRLYWIQFESYWPDHPNNHYDYTGDRREQHWGNTVWVNSGPGSTTTPPRPGGDRAHVQAMLEKAGYKAPPEMMNVRMIQLLDDPKGTGHGRRELMFIYAEDLAKTGKTLAELTDAKGENNAAWEPLDQPLVQRATTAFSVELK